MLIAAKNTQFRFNLYFAVIPGDAGYTNRLAQCFARRHVFYRKLPEADKNTPAADVRFPFTDAKVPNADENVPVTDVKVTVADENIPAADVKIPFTV